MLAETPASLRDPQLEQKAALLSEKVRILEEGLGRFVGRERAKAKEESERCAPRHAGTGALSASGGPPRAPPLAAASASLLVPARAAAPTSELTIAAWAARREHLLSGAARREQDENLQALTREGNSLQKSERMVDEMMQQVHTRHASPHAEHSRGLLDRQPVRRCR